MGNIDANLWTNVPCNETKKAIGTNEKYHFIFIYIITCVYRDKFIITQQVTLDKWINREKENTKISNYN